MRRKTESGGLDAAVMSSGPRLGGLALAAHDLAEARAAAAGDDAAFSRLFDRHAAAIARRMGRYTRDPNQLQELVQDVFVEAFLHLSKYKGRAPLQHWLARLATRVGFRFWRRERRRRRVLALSLEAGAELQVAHVVQTAETAESLCELRTRLAERDRLVLSLLYWEGCTVQETAARLGWTEGMVKVQAHRARKRLRALWDAAENA